MSLNDYVKAQKLGEKRYQAALSKNEYPYLPVLDELITNSDIAGEVNLGLQHISLDRVVGTATKGRTTAFASNFMPILDANSEFGNKWSSLCDSHIEEGIHDPIKVYEYMNKFYVIEGNKRVSVLKYFGADSVPAMVTRKLPKRTDEPENKIYYEFVDFHKQTGINYIWFTQLGGYDKLREYIGLTPDGGFTDDDRMNLNSAHLAFETAYKQKNGSDSLPITVDDAMLVFLNVYGYKALQDMSYDEVKENLEKVWDEIVLSAQKKNMTIVPKLEPVESKKKLFSITPVPKKLKIAFVYDKEPENSVWIYSHDLGRMGVEGKFKDRVETHTFSNMDDNTKLAECLEQIAQDKFDVVFTTGPEMLPESLKAAIKYPELKILNCSLNVSTSHVRTYYARMYEAKFITGIIAGSLCEDGRIGYVADYPIYGTTANINAFAMGAKFVNPRAKIYLEWSKVKGSDPKKRFKELGISYVSDKDMITPLTASREFGLYSCDGDEISNLAMPFYNWRVFYEKIVQLILDGNWKLEEKNEKVKVLNYWWGMSAGAIDIIYGGAVPDETKKVTSLIREAIVKGEFKPFTGELKDQDGKVRNKPDEELDPDEIIEMDWLLDNVVGRVPEYEELDDNSKMLVINQGIIDVND